jgi:hypothetical protein
LKSRPGFGFPGWRRLVVDGIKNEFAVARNEMLRLPVPHPMIALTVRFIAALALGMK